MTDTKVKSARGSRRWAGWDEKPLEGRRMMSAVPLVAELHTASADGDLTPGRHGRLGAKQPSTITIENQSTVAIMIKVTDIDNRHWEGHNRPDHNLQNVVIPAGNSITEPEDMNTYRYPRFTIVLQNAETKAEIGKTRAEFEWFTDGDVIHGWRLEPTSKTFDNAGHPLVFYSLQSESSQSKYKGLFILDDAAG